jgi:hypothetical protein
MPAFGINPYIAGGKVTYVNLSCREAAVQGADVGRRVAAVRGREEVKSGRGNCT